MHKEDLKNYKHEIEHLYFHDSEISSINLEYDSASGRKCTVIIDYYNWEGNSEENSTWHWKKLKITFNYLAQLQWNAPDFINTSSVILETEYDQFLDELFLLESNKKLKYKGYRSPIFNESTNYLSIKFILSNFEDGLISDTGYLLLIGSDVCYEWLDDELRTGKIHVPIK